MHRTLLPISLAVLAFPAFAQTPASNSPGYPGEQNAVTIRPQIRRPPPPSPDASQMQLEYAGDKLREQKLFLDAVDYYQAAMAKTPKAKGTALLHNKCGIAYLQLSRLKEAKKEFERAIKMDREYADAYNNLGVVLYVQKKFKPSIRQYTKALQLREPSPSFHNNIATAYFARKEYEKATAHYVRALELDPDVFERQATGGIQAHLSSPEDRARYSYVLARMFAEHGYNDRALRYLRRAMEDGYEKIDDVYKDDQFAKLREDPRFAELMAARPTPLP
jgi:tetratricopeptide (TPR) repeat protein